jgi:hypothetical protein
MLISGPTQSGVDMDVFLEPLMEDMKILWVTGVQMLDDVGGLRPTKVLKNMI